MILQYVGMLIFAGHIWRTTEDLPFQLKFGNTKCERFIALIKLLGIFTLAPIAELIFLSLFICCFKFSSIEKQVKYLYRVSQKKGGRAGPSFLIPPFFGTPRLFQTRLSLN